jgi:hypothetical protein
MTIKQTEVGTIQSCQFQVNVLLPTETFTVAHAIVCTKQRDSNFA